MICLTVYTGMILFANECQTTISKFLWVDRENRYSADDRERQILRKPSGNSGLAKRNTNNDQQISRETFYTRFKKIKEGMKITILKNGEFERYKSIETDEKVYCYVFTLLNAKITCKIHSNDTTFTRNHTLNNYLIFIYL